MAFLGSYKPRMVFFPLINDKMPTIFMLKSTEHEILNAQKYKNIKKIGFF